MPELPEVEVLVRHLRPCLRQKTIHQVKVKRARVVAPSSVRAFDKTLRGSRFINVSRRGKYLVFTLQRPRRTKPLVLLGHLGMTGRMYLTNGGATLPKHVSVLFDLGPQKFVFEDTRYFGKLTLDVTRLRRLGPEPLEPTFTLAGFSQALSRSSQAIKVKLLDQSLIAGIGNIYASEALFRARISPAMPARKLKPKQISRLWTAVREVLTEAIECGSTVPLNYSGKGGRNKLFYFGTAPGKGDLYEERLEVYDRAGQPCTVCGTLIKRRVQAARSTFYCSHCQRARAALV